MCACADRIRCSALPSLESPFNDDNQNCPWRPNFWISFSFFFFNNFKTCVGNWLPDNLYTALGAFTPLFHATLHCSCVIFQEDFQPPVSMSLGRITSLFLLTHLYNHKTASKEALNLFVLGLQSYVPLSPPSSISLGRFGGAGTCSEVWSGMPGATRWLRNMVCV